jgi:hypothetical protein
MWTLHACGLMTDSLIAAMLSEGGHKSEYLRAWAIQLDMEDGQPQDLHRLEEMAATDDSALVRCTLLRRSSSYLWTIVAESRGGSLDTPMMRPTTICH